MTEEKMPRGAFIRIFVDGREHYGFFPHADGIVPVVGDEVEIEEMTEIGPRTKICIVERRRHYWPSPSMETPHATWDDRWVREIEEFGSCICLYLKTINAEKLEWRTTL